MSEEEYATGKTQAPAPRTDALFRFSHGHRVRYDEVDAQGIVGNASWVNLFQLGRIEYLRYLGLMLEGTRAPVQPVVRRCAIDYLAPARFDDPVAIRVRTAQLGNRSAKLEYVIDNLETGLRPAVGETLIVCVDLASMRSVPWPAAWRERIGEFEGANLEVRP